MNCSCSVKNEFQSCGIGDFSTSCEYSIMSCVYVKSIIVVIVIMICKNTISQKYILIKFIVTTLT